MPASSPYRRASLDRGWAGLVLLTIALHLSPATGQSSQGQLRPTLDAAAKALAGGQPERAFPLFEAAHRDSPDNLEAARGLVVSALEAGNLAVAEQYGAEFLGRWPTDAQLLHWTGLVYFKQQRTTEALSLLRRSVAQNSSDFGSRFDLALVLLTEKQYAPAAEELEHALKLRPDDSLAHVLLGRAYQNSNRTLQAVTHFQSALKLDPATPLGHYHLGFAYESLGRTTLAIAEYKKEIARGSSNPEVLFQLGSCLLETGDATAAIAELRRAAQLDARNGDIQYTLGKALLASGDNGAAISTLRSAAGLKPSDPSPHYLLARALENAGRKTDAQSEWQRFAELKKAQPQQGGMASGRDQ
ncbi:MAG: tetratricopeptide repeat protein [Acidobacteriales bacterium]|nr:tetratricopeptide repeat protein [Terriglobales bacterium]